MSQSSIEEFFPFSSKIVKVWFPEVWLTIFPFENAVACPAPSLRITSLGRQFDVRWPVLALACGFGALHGLVMGLSILCDRRNPDPGRYSWGMAFVFYACMSTSGLLYHSMLQEKTLGSGLAYAGDMAFTACSCLSIAFGGLVDMGLLSDASVRLDPSPKQMLFGNAISVRTIHRLLSAAIVAVVFVSHFLGIEVIPDQVYVQGVAVAGLFAGVLPLMQPRWLVGDRMRAVQMPAAPKRCLLLLGPGVAAAIAATALADGLLCRVLHSANLSMISLGFWVFNFGMVGLQVYYHAGRDYRLRRHKLLLDQHGS